MKATLHFSLLCLPLLSSATYIRAIRVTPVLLPRQNGDSDLFTGGWGLRTTGTCPSGTQTCKAVGPVNCCPTDSECVEDNMIGDNYIACCPKGSDSCVGVIKALPVCADPSWVLWKGPERIGDEPFCCREGEIGYVTLEWRKSGACGSWDLAIDPTQSAITIRPATAKRTDSPTGTESSSSRKTSNTSDSDPESNPDSDTNSRRSGSKSTSKGGIGKTAVIGVIAGAVIVVLLMAFIAWFAIRRGRKRAYQEGMAAAAVHKNNEPKAENIIDYPNKSPPPPQYTQPTSPGYSATSTHSQNPVSYTIGSNYGQNHQQHAYQLDHTARPPLAEVEGTNAQGTRR